MSVGAYDGAAKKKKRIRRRGVYSKFLTQLHKTNNSNKLVNY